MQPHQIISLDDPRRAVSSRWPTTTTTSTSATTRRAPRHGRQDGKQFDVAPRSPTSGRGSSGASPRSTTRRSRPRRRATRCRPARASKVRPVKRRPRPATSLADRPGRIERLSATGSLRFVQLDVPGRLGLDDGRYLLRRRPGRAGARRCSSSRRWGRAPPAGRRRRRPRRPSPPIRGRPPEVPITRLTVITARIAGRERLPRASSMRLRRTRPRPRRPSPRAYGRSTGAAGHRIATTIPTATRSAARRRWSPYGSASAPATGSPTGSWRRPSRSPMPERRRRRAEALRPAGAPGRPCSPAASRSTFARRCCYEPAPTSTRAGRARPRFSSSRASTRCSPSSRTVRAAGPGGDLADASGAPRVHRRGCPAALRGRAVGRARRRARRDAPHLRARPAPPPDRCAERALRPLRGPPARPAGPRPRRRRGARRPSES